MELARGSFSGVKAASFPSLAASVVRGGEWAATYSLENRVGGTALTGNEQLLSLSAEIASYTAVQLL